jgi:hypothetical protein
MTNGEISKILQCLDLGLATSPRQLIQKSGSVAAMLEHGLPILVTRNDWRLRGTASRLEEMPSQMFSSEQFRSLTSLPTRKPQPTRESGVRVVAERMVAEMNSVLSGKGWNLA